MPYTRETMPDAIKGLPTHAQDVWLAAFNAAFEEYKGDEGKSNATAWAAVEKAGYAKNEKGEWAKTEQHKEEPPKGKDEKKPPAKEEHKETEDFTQYEGVLAGVALLGEDIPAVKTLSDVVALGANGELKGVEIFEAGYHKGKFYDLAHLDRAARLFGELKDKVRPPLKLGHGEQALLEREGLPAAGWVEDVRRVGRKLVADFKDVPEKVREAVRLGRYKRISAEFYPSLNLAEAPEKRQSMWLFAEPDTKGGDKKMQKFTEEELKLKVEEELEKATEKFAEDLAKAKSELKAKEKTLTELKAKQRETVVTAFAESLKKGDGKSGLAPALADMATEIFSVLDSERVEKFAEGTVEKPVAEYFSDFMGEFVKRAKASKGLIVQFGEKAPGADDRTPEERAAEEEKAEVAAMVGAVQPKKAAVN